MSTVSHTSAVFGRRACAVVAVASAVLHATMLGHAGNPVTAVFVLAMAAACLGCAYELWRGCGLRTWCVVAVMNLAMIAVHWSMPTHHHGAAAPEQVSGLMALATTVSLLEAGVATAVLYVLTRRREPSAIM